MANALFKHRVINSKGLHNNEQVSLPAKVLTYYEESEGIPEFCLKLAKARENSLAVVGWRCRGFLEGNQRYR
jgi:hypothetical protein